MFYTFDMSSFPCLLYSNTAKFTFIWFVSIPSMRSEMSFTSFFISFTSWTRYFFITCFCRIFHLLTKKVFKENTFFIYSLSLQVGQSYLLHSHSFSFYCNI